VLTQLHVHNLAVVDEVDLEFHAGFAALTGETGAGKSILVDAMGLILGERGGAGLVRSGAKRAEITATFDMSGLAAAKEWLEEQALDLDDECLLRRVINADGRSRAFVNGNAVPLQSLKSLGEKLVDIHGQHFHQSLGHRSVQRDLLDHFGELLDQRATTDIAFAEWQALAGALEALEQADADRASRLDLLTFQCGELEALDLAEGEFDALHAERQKLQNSGRLADGVEVAIQAIYDTDSNNAQSLLAESCQSLESLIEFDDKLLPALEMLKEAEIQVSEAADTLRRYGDNLDMDPQRRDQVELRLDAIQAIARKHRVSSEELPDLQVQLSQQLHDLRHAEEVGAELAAKTESARQSYRDAAAKLSAGRKKSAKQYSSLVSAAMADLGMMGGRFSVDIKTDADADPRPWGVDNIEYLISANPGQPLLPLSKVASGGELSRMSLAIQVIASDGSEIPTMVFDEVDSGIGGGVAEMVGRRLHDLGETRQVFSVTHLAQVAGLANNHFRVVKISDTKTTRTAITHLTDDERIEELARMLGGVEISQATRDHAAEMLKTDSRRAKA
jgi:DNA repair protein RecN (Recombination protein N)